MDKNDKLILRYINSITYDNGTSRVEDDTVREFLDQDEKTIVRTAYPIPGVKRGWLGNLTVTKEYCRLFDCMDKIKLNEVLSDMLCIRVNTHVGNDMNPVNEYVFLKY